MPEGRLLGEFRALPDFMLKAEVLYGRARDSVDGKYNLQVDSLVFEFSKLVSERDWLQYGMVTNKWEELADRFWGYRHLGVRGPTLSLRYGYLAHSDLGLMAGADFESWGKFSLGVVNGEGSGADEQGPRKDFHFVYSVEPNLGWQEGRVLTLAVLAIEGGYDNIDAEMAQKERLGFLLGFSQPVGWQGSLELLSTKDPVDGINLLIADRVDLTAQGGQIAKGQGGSLILKYRWPGAGELRQYEVFSRTDRWNPALGIEGKAIRSQMLGFGFFPRQPLQISLAWSEVQYEINHAAAVRDTSDLNLAVRLKW